MSFYPEEQRQGDIKFIFARFLSYKIRMALIFIFLFGGLAFQLVFNFWYGFGLVLIGSALSWIAGYSATPKLKAGEEKWDRVTPDEYTKVKTKQKELKAWDIDAFDITNYFGFIILFILTVFAVYIGYLLKDYVEDTVLMYWGIDFAVIVFPHWITGVRTFLKRDKLIIKIGLLEEIMKQLSAPSDVQVLPMLSTSESEEGGRVPSDARLLLRLVDAPDYFLGVQIQITLNNVQGHDYPYLYAVIIAKKEAKLFEKNKKNITSRNPKIIFENTSSEGVDVLVIRQATTKTSGYYTDSAICAVIVETALNIAREITK